MVKISIIGSTGQMGSYMIDQALHRNYELVLLVRPGSQKKLPEYVLNNPLVTIAETKFKSEEGVETMANAIKGSEGLISIAGPVFGVKDGNAHEIYPFVNQACRKANVQRLVILSTPSTQAPQDSFSLFWYIFTVLFSRLFPYMYNDTHETGNFYRTVTDLDWTVIRVPFLHDKPAKNGLNLGYVSNMEFGGVGFWGSRVTLSEYFLDQIFDKTWIRKLPLAADK